MTTACSNTASYDSSPQFDQGQFRNVVERKALGWRKTMALWWQFTFKDGTKTVPPSPLDIVPVTRAQLDQAPDGSVYRLGHSTVLLKLDGAFWLTDPVFSERASPVQWAGPKRFFAPPIALADLPPLAAVILSHDHFDHLDKASVVALIAKTDLFITPLGVGDHLLRWGVPADKIRQLDWWGALQVQGLRFVATPAQHFSGRSLFASNPTLWASWVIQSSRHKIFFSGDTGYHAGFAEIGRREGPFDLTLLEAGAYDPQWEDVHMLPEQVIQAHRDLRGEWLLPIHNVTFDLAFHAWDEPLERLVALAAQGPGVQLTIPRIGEPVQIENCQPPQPWWRGKRSQPDAINRELSSRDASLRHRATESALSPPATLRHPVS